jgi:hypothetical protein
MILAERSSASVYTLWSEERDKAPPPWLIRGLLAKVSLAGVYGPGGSYKSFIILDAALAIAQGATEWAGLQITDPGAPIVYVAGEGSATGRAKAWEAVKGEVGTVTNLSHTMASIYPTPPSFRVSNPIYRNSTVFGVALPAW